MWRRYQSHVRWCQESHRLLSWHVIISGSHWMSKKPLSVPVTTSASFIPAVQDVIHKFWEAAERFDGSQIFHAPIISLSLSASSWQLSSSWLFQGFLCVRGLPQAVVTQPSAQGWNQQPLCPDEQEVEILVGCVLCANVRNSGTRALMKLVQCVHESPPITDVVHKAFINHFKEHLLNESIVHWTEYKY